MVEAMGEQLRGQMKGPFEFISSREVFKNPWIRLREDKVIRPGGTPGTFGIIEMKPGVTVLAIDSDQNTFLVAEYKYGIDAESIELMSGGIDAKETPLEAAKRELQEELGLIAQRWEYLGLINPFTTVVDSPNHMFLALGLEHGTAAPDPGEVLRVIRKPFQDVVQMVMEGAMTHGASCVLVLKAASVLSRPVARE